MQDKPHKPTPAVVTRLAMSDVIWAHWDITPFASQEQRSSSRYRSLLNILLKDPLPGPSNASDRDSPMPAPSAGISLEPKVVELNDMADSLRDRISSDPLLVRPWDWYENKKKYFEDERGKTQKDTIAFGAFFGTNHVDNRINFIVEGLGQCELTANRTKLRRAPELLAAQMNLFACRVYLNSTRAAGLIHGPLGEDLAAPGHVVIDLRFREHLGHYWLYATFTVYTYEPRILSWDPLAPSGTVRDREDVFSLADDLEALRDRYAQALRRGFQDHVHAFFPAAQVTILGREYQPPRFWVATGREHRSPWFWVATGRDLAMTSAASRNGRVVGQHDLLGTLLRVPGPDTMGLGIGDIGGRTGGRARVFRRFVSSPRLAHDRPVYLILPLASSAIDEDDLQKMIQTLSDLEADAATRLLEIITDIDMYRSQLNLYEKVGAQGLALWDQIALFLPVVRGSDIGKAHRLIELIHQIVLQGIADLEEEAANAQHTIERIEAVAHDLTDRFDREFTERPVSGHSAMPGHSAIRDSLIKAGYFDKARRDAQSVIEKSHQVRSTYQALMKSMTYAFDERRARETDVLQWVALFFAGVLGIVSIWNEFLAQYIDLWKADWWVGSGLAAIIIVIVVVLVRRSRRSRLTSDEFNEHFEELQKLLAAYSSDRLARLRAADEQDALEALGEDKANSEGGEIATRAQDRVLRNAAENWRLFDRMLAQKTAELLDNLSTPRLRPPPREPGWTERLSNADLKENLKEMHKRLEAWALRALLVTERPRQFWSSALPLLTFLYRFFPITSEKPSRESDWSAAENQVSDYDFILTAVNHCGCVPKNAPTLIRWSHLQVRTLPNASEFVEALQKIGISWHEGLGIDPHMTNERFHIMMDNMNKSLRESNMFNDDGWGEKASKTLKAAKSLKPDEHSDMICEMAEDSAQRGLTAYLLRVGTRVPNNCDLIHLGAEFRAATGDLPSDLQDAIWRLSAYQDLRAQPSAHPTGRTTSRAYGVSDARKALDDAEIVFNYVNE
ncbi:MAG: HEPN domain-containing protein [Pseudonocardiaceae bacterium]